MASVSERISFIRGLMEGLKMNKEDDTVKILDLIVSVLDSLSEASQAHEAELMELNDYVESIDDDLAELEMEHDGGDLESMNNGEDEDEFYSFADDELPRKRGKLSFLRDADEAMKDQDDDDDFDEDEFELEDAETEFFIGCVCPECGKFFSVKNPDDYEDDQKFICPFCRKKVILTPIDPASVPAAEPAED